MYNFYLKEWKPKWYLIKKLQLEILEVLEIQSIRKGI